MSCVLLKTWLHECNTDGDASHKEYLCLVFPIPIFSYTMHNLSLVYPVLFLKSSHHQPALLFTDQNIMRARSSIDAHAQISWRMKSWYYPPWKHSQGAVAQQTLLEMQDVFGPCGVAERAVSPANSRPAGPPTGSSLQQSSVPLHYIEFARQ